MFKYLPCIALVLAAPIASAGSGVPKEWSSRYQGIMRMLEKKDVTSFEALFDPSFVSIDPRGNQSNREEFFKMVDGIFKNASKVYASARLTSFNKTKDRVDVGFDFHLTVQHKGQAPTHLHEVGVDSWKQFNHKWYFVKTVDKSLTMGETKPKKKIA